MKNDRVEGVVGGQAADGQPLGKKLPSRQSARPLPPSIKSLEEAISFLSDQIIQLIYAKAVVEERDLNDDERKRVAHAARLITKYSPQVNITWPSDDDSQE